MKRLLSFNALPRALTPVVQDLACSGTPARPVLITRITQKLTNATSVPATKQIAGRISAVSLRSLTTVVSRRVSG